MADSLCPYRLTPVSRRTAPGRSSMELHGGKVAAAQTERTLGGAAGLVVTMGLFKRTQSNPITHVAGERASVLVTSVKRDSLSAVFGQLAPLSEQDFSVTLRAMPPNEYNATPVVVWVNGVHVGYINDDAAPQYWSPLRQRKDTVACDCVVKADAFAGANKIRLSLPARF